jgi:hypothetical protein
MSKPESAVLRLREDPDYFRAATDFTAQMTAFAPRLVREYQQRRPARPTSRGNRAASLQALGLEP